jgi:drug/metabolite transporter (DMT)-like permease
MWIFYAVTSAFFYGAVNILDSVLINKYEKSPVVYLCYAGFFMAIILGIFALFYDVRTDWMLFLIASTTVGYIGDLFYFHTLKKVDVSVANACWAILAIFLSIGGFILFSEQWTLAQGAGALLILGGIFFLSYWHRHVSITRTVLMFSGAALFFAPAVLTQKAALLAGEDVITVAYWVVMGRNIPNIIVPLFRREWRRGVFALHTRVRLDFYIVMFTVIFLWFTGMYFSLKAFEVGFVSLVSIVGNVQPFFVILQAWLITLLLPRFAPRELLTAQSVQVKLVSFIVVFGGLSLLTLG